MLSNQSHCWSSVYSGDQLCNRTQWNSCHLPVRLDDIKPWSSRGKAFFTSHRCPFTVCILTPSAHHQFTVSQSANTSLSCSRQNLCMARTTCPTATVKSPHFYYYFIFIYYYFFVLLYCAPATVFCDSVTIVSSFIIIIICHFCMPISYESVSFSWQMHFPISC